MRQCENVQVIRLAGAFIMQLDHPRFNLVGTEDSIFPCLNGLAPAIKRLWDRGVIEHVADGYRIADPLLAACLRRYR